MMGSKRGKSMIRQLDRYYRGTANRAVGPVKLIISNDRRYMLHIAAYHREYICMEKSGSTL